MRQIRAGAGGDLGGAVKLHGGPIREFSSVGGAPCALFEVMLKRPGTDAPPPPLPLLELTPELARAFYDDGGAAPAPQTRTVIATSPQTRTVVAQAELGSYQSAGTAPAPLASAVYRTALHGSLCPLVAS